MHCKNCGKETLNESLLCPECAAKEDDARAKQMTHDEWRAQMAQRIGQKQPAANNRQMPPQKVEAPAFCSSCGAKLAQGAAFCSSCGRPVGQAQPQAAVQEQDTAKKKRAKKKPIYKRVWFWLLVFFVIFLMLPSNGSESSSGSSSSGNSQTSSSAAASAEKVTIAETVIYDQGGVKVTAKSIEETYAGIEVKMLVENSTSDNISVGCDNFVVNGVSISGFMHISAAAGKKTNDSLTLYSSELKTAGIDQIASIKTIDAYISDSDTFMKIKSIDFEINSSIAGKHVQSIDDSGEVLYSGNGITVISKGISDGFTGSDANILIKNQSGQDVIVQADNVSVNDCTIYSLHSTTIADGTVCFSSIPLLETYLEENEIESVEDVTFQLKVLNPSNFTTITKTGELSITPN